MLDRSRVRVRRARSAPRGERRSPLRRRSVQLAALLGVTWGLAGFTWQTGPPEGQGLSTPALAALVALSDSIDPDTGLMVMRNDVVVLEHYSGARGPTSKFTTRSLTKSFGAGLLVRALDDGVVTLAEQGCSRPDVSIHLLASMASGMKKEAEETCDTPFYFEPGEDFAYSDGSANAVADKLREHYGPDLLPLMTSAIMNPIGVENWDWTDQRFSSGLRISVRDMLRYGRLWMRGGDWDGVQVLSQSGVALATSTTNPELKGDYGYFWWVNGPTEPYERYGYKLGPLFPPSAPPDAFLGAGCTSTYLLVVPSLQLVAARAGGPCVSIRNRTTEFTDGVHAFVEAVLASVSACSDGVDNDGNGQIDYPEDPGCSDLADTTEMPAVPAAGDFVLALLALVLAATGMLAAGPRVRGRVRPGASPR